MVEPLKPVNVNKTLLLAMCLLATFVIAGIVTTMGLIIPRAADKFAVSATAMASQFTWLTGGVLAGYVLSFFVFDHVRIRTALLAGYIACVGALLLIHFATSFAMLAAWLALFGVAISIAVCGSGTLITQLWQGRVRQTVIVAQDAMFNGGGVLFSAVATWFIARQFPFSSLYLVLSVIIVLVLALVVRCDFQRDLLQVDEAEAAEGPTQWNSGIVLIGVSLLLFMLAKIAIFIWAPQYVEQRFAVDSVVSGRFMSYVFMAALVGSLAGTWLVSRVNVKYLVYGFVLLSALAVGLLLQAQSVETALRLAFVYGLSVSATFNAYVAFALTFVVTPTHRNIAYMLLMSALGSSGAPLFSSQAVEFGGEIRSALVFCLATLLVVIVTLAVSEVLGRRARAAQAGAVET